LVVNIDGYYLNIERINILIKKRPANSRTLLIFLQFMIK